PAVARELVAGVLLAAPEVGRYRAPTTLRGIDDRSFQLHRATIVQGSQPAPHSFELVLGRRVADSHPALTIGTDLALPGGASKIVGIFEADGSPFEDEVWTVRGAVEIHRKTKGLSSITIAADDPAHVDDLVKRVNAMKNLHVRAMTASAFQAQGAGLS